MIIRTTTERMDVELDTEEKVIWVIQRWKCRFVSERYRDKWKEQEKKNFRINTRDFIEAIWGKAAHFTVESCSGNKFNVMYGGTAFLVKVRLEFVEAGEHWTAVIYKQYNPIQYGFVSWFHREIYLTEKPWTNPLGVRNPDGSEAAMQIIVAHEFGHTIGNSGDHVMGSGKNQYTGDEYKPDSVFYKDKCSIMNEGSELRSRHFIYLRDLLHSMVPGTQFSLTMGGVVDLIPWD